MPPPPMPASLDPVDPSLHGVLKCKQAGCETQWYHLQCVSLEQIPRNWVCEACEASGRRWAGKRLRK
ncbi:hypothetical protein B0H34DRAFT_709473 [Crassisporium funariophilum]|nr:hypothetical protein B0H34DRAFT_709473 [Crassisporium funariophilum]